EAKDGLPKVSTFTICKILHEAGSSWQLDRSWFDTGVVKRKRKAGTVTVKDPESDAKKN
ncbi:MAG: helix-turn-helix domain-containing protein, partial [Chloroflexi bacterium]